VILATNAYTNFLMLDAAIPATSTQHTYMLATEPLKPDMLDRISQTRTPFGDPALSSTSAALLRIGSYSTASIEPPGSRRRTIAIYRPLSSCTGKCCGGFRSSNPSPWRGMGWAVLQTPSDAPIVRRSKSNPDVVLNIGYGGGSGVGMALLSVN